MNKILVLGEGNTEKGVINAIAKRLNLKIRFLRMRGNKPEKLCTFIRTEREYDKYIILKDLKPYGKEEVVKRKIDNVRSKLDERTKNKVKHVIVKQEIEAWFLADPQALERAFNCKIERRIVNPEEVDEPEKELNNLLRKCGKTYYKSEQVASRITMEMNLEEVANKSNSFNTFLKNLYDP